MTSPEDKELSGSKAYLGAVISHVIHGASSFAGVAAAAAVIFRKNPQIEIASMKKIIGAGALAGSGVGFVAASQDLKDSSPTEFAKKVEAERHAISDLSR